MLRKTSQKNLMVCRNEDGLKETLESCVTLEKELVSAPRGVSINLRNFELMSMITSIKLMVSAALERKESRGSHHREDYPLSDKNYDLPFVLESADGKICVKQEALH